MYAEATDNENVHNGLYSLKDNKWIDEPKKLKPVDNDIAVNAKYKELAKAIEEVADKEESTQLMDKIKRMRKAGLAKEGEFSVENLVFKKLRNEGLIGKLADIKKQEIDKELSLEEAYERAISAIEEMCTSTVAMAPYATPVVGQEQPTAPKKENRHKQKKAILNYKYKKTWGTKNDEPIVEALMGEIGDVCENILDEIRKEKERKQAVTKASATVLPQREEILKDAIEKVNASPRKDVTLEKARQIAQLRVNKAKKNLGFKVDEELIESLINLIIESKQLSNEEKELLAQFRDSAPGNVHADTTDRYKKSQGRISSYKENMQDSDETGKKILKGQIKREKQQNINRYNQEASEKDPELKKKQKDAIWKFIRKKQANIGKN